jgi:hypothetical protein
VLFNRFPAMAGNLARCSQLLAAQTAYARRRFAERPRWCVFFPPSKVKLSLCFPRCYYSGSGDKALLNMCCNLQQRLEEKKAMQSMRDSCAPLGDPSTQGGSSA